MRTIFTLLLICGLFNLESFAQYKPPTIPAFGILGARWYYKNIGKNSEKVKHIYVEQSGIAKVSAYNMQTKLYEDVKTSRLVFHYLDEDSVTVEYDTLLIKTFPNSVSWYDPSVKLFTALYSALNGGNFEGKVVSYHPFAIGNWDYWARQITFQRYLRTSCLLINGKVLAKYEIDTFPCWTYPLGNAIIERIGSLDYMLRFDSCKKDLYGGPLLWYYDPEIGLYEHGKTKIEMCEFEEPKDTMFTGIAEESLTQNLVKIYPSPFTNSLYLESKTNSASSIYIYAMDGKCFYTEKLHARENISINTANWLPGIYIVKQETGNVISTRKVVKL